MKTNTRLLMMGAFACATWVGCVRSEDIGQSSMSLSGVVTDEAGVAVANAVVSVGDVSATTDATGAYRLTPAAKLGEAGVAVVAATGYGRRTQPLAYTTLRPTYSFVLRRSDNLSSFPMPEAGGAAQSVAVTRGDGGVVLRVLPGSLQKPDGSLVSGLVTASLTYWHPGEELGNPPAPLYGQDARDPDTGMVSLLTYGMADVVLTQGNDVLQVSPGKTIDLAFTLPSMFAAAVAQTAITAPDAPHLWYADEATGLWSRVGDQNDGTLAFDVNTRVMTAHLPHLSAWNLDGKMTTNACVRGRVIDCHNNAVANAQAWLWVMGKGQVGHWPVATAADGSYCTNIAGTSRDIRSNGGAYDSNGFVWISLPKKPAASTCNPTGIDNFSELCAPGKGSATICVTEEKTPAFYAAAAKACNTIEPVLKSCGFCQGTGVPGGTCVVRDSRGTSDDGTPGTIFNVGYKEGDCTVLPDLVLPVGDCPNSNTPADRCANKGSTIGIVCSTDADCCPNNTLECADAHCVPRTSAE